MNSNQITLLKSLKLSTSFDGLSDDELIYIEDVLSSEIQHRGINDTGNGLNEYGQLCLDVILTIPDN